MRWLFRRGQAQMLSAYVDGLIVKRRTGRDRAPREDRAEGESLDDLVELAQLLNSIEFRLPDTLYDRLEDQLASTRPERPDAREASAERTAAGQIAARAVDDSRLAETTAPILTARPRGRAPLRALIGAAGVAAMLTAAILDWRLTRVSAAELLRESATVVRTAAQQKDVVVHRVVRLEQRDLTHGGRIVGRQRIETWERGDRGVLARRAFDEQQRLVAGRWRDGGGSDRTIYARESQPAPGQDTSTQATDEASGEPSDELFDGLPTAWQMDLSAEAFIALLPEPSRARVVSSGDHYVVAYDAPEPGETAASTATTSGATASGTAPSTATAAAASRLAASTSALRAATLTLRRDTLWPVRQTVIIARGGALNEYRFEETSFERMPESRVGAQVFALDASLLRETPAPAPMPPPVIARTPVAPPAPAPVLTGVVREKLLLDAWTRLHRFDACLDDATTVTIDAHQHVAVRAMVFDEGRRQLLVRTFESYAPPESLTLEVDLHTPATGEQMSSAAESTALLGSTDPTDSTDAAKPLESSGSPAIAEPAVPIVPRPAAPALAAVREHFRDRAGYEPESVIGPQLDEATRQFAQWTLERSARRVEEAGALARHLAQWSPDAARLLDLDARAAWMSMLRQHAKAFAQETEMLRLQLSTVFLPIAGDAAADPFADEARGAPQLPEAIARLRDLAAAQDLQIRHAFAPAGAAAVSQDAAPFGQAEAARLVRALAQTERLAQGFNDPQLLDR
jgi:hypothetical protein